MNKTADTISRGLFILAIAVAGASGCVMDEVDEGHEFAETIDVQNHELVGGVTQLSENFEGNISAWTTTGLWHRVANSSCASPGYSSAIHAMYFGQDSSCDYSTGAQVTGALVSPVVSGLLADAELSFSYFRQVESYSSSYDQTEVAVSTDGGGNWTTVWSRDSTVPSQSAWVSETVSLAAYAGQDVQVQFTFDSIDSYANAYVGWLIDDVRITGSAPAAFTLNTYPLIESRNVTFGFKFEPASPIEMTSVGHFDYAFDGLVASHRIGIWLANGALLTEVLLPAGTAGTLQGEYRYIDLPTPVLLFPGQDYIIGVQTQKSEHYPWQNSHNPASDIIFKGGTLQGVGAGLIFPYASAGSHRRSPVNFLFRDAP